MSRLPRRRQRGATLLVTALVLFLLMLGLGLVDGALLARMRAVQDESRRVELQALVDAAMAETLAALAADPRHGGFAAHPFGNGRIASRVEPVEADRYRVRAVGRLGERELAIEAQVERLWGRPVVTTWRFAPLGARRG